MLIVYYRGNRSPAASHSQAGFTLVELLATTAIIGILAALILLVATRVRVAAYRSASAGNLRQWGSTMLLYQADNRGHLPVEGNYQGNIPGTEAEDFAWWQQVGHVINTKAWYNVLPPYAGESALRDLMPGSTYEEKRQHVRDFRQSLFYAPGSELRDIAVTGASSSNRVPLGYFINSQLYNIDAATFTGTSSSRLRSEGLPYNLIPFPGKVAFMAEARVSNDELVIGYDKGGGDVFRARGQGGHVASRYGGRTSIVFFDGSVRTYDSRTVKASSTSLGIVWNPWTP
jgi:prepilin-type N-terminal cleavage/methylation domain-containing protein/prepilin-type processing-associated H-X9-DG protein